MRLLVGAIVLTMAVSAFGETSSTLDFVIQVLEPTGGKILRPRDWFYREGHRGPTYRWTLSREDSNNQSYTTGVRIQMFVGVKEGTGKTAREFIADIAGSRKKAATKIISACGEQDQGVFTRICLETEEGLYHILYSLFWGNRNLDIAVVVTSGTTKDLWSTYSSVFKTMMGEFELIDTKRFDKQP